MKKIILSLCILYSMSTVTAQTCPGIEGLTPITLRWGTGATGNPQTAFPLIPLYWNRYYKADENTGQIVPVTCAFTGDPNITELAYCVCYMTGTYFRKVTDVCDPTPCGGDVGLPQLPTTDKNNSSDTWSQPSTWIGNLVPDISSSLGVMLTKSTQVDIDLVFPTNHWFIVAAGNSSILSGKTVTNNSVIQIYAGAQLENFGTLKGSGQIAGSLINSGTLSPGNSPGKFTIAGNYTATGTAIHQIEIAAANDYDTISITANPSIPSGTAVINGALNVSLLNGFVPSLGDVFKVFTFTSATGVFSTTNLPSLPVGLTWSIQYNPGDISLTVVNLAPLPLTFTSTRAYAKNNGVQVDWITESENNVKNYEVEKSMDGIHFNKAATIDAKENGSGINYYGWFDAFPATSNNYYRIKAVDIDGKFMYTSILLIKLTGETKISVYPNPLQRGNTLQLSLHNRIATSIEIITTSGQILYSKSGKLTGSVSVLVSSSWPIGQYLLRMVFENKTETQKIMVQ